MKVITQLIRHFWQRGALSSHEVEYLLRQGFVRPADLPGLKLCKSSQALEAGRADIEVAPPDELDLLEESLVRRTAVDSGRKAARPQVSIGELRRRLRRDFHRRARHAQSLLALGRRFEEMDSWQQAAAQLHAVEAAEFSREFMAGLRDESLLLGQIWLAVYPERFHRLVRANEVRGRAVRAFLALLVADGPDALGKHAWILRYREMQTVINLRVAYRRLLDCLRGLFLEQRPLLGRALRWNSDRVQVWSLILLYNASRDASWGDAPRYGHEYGPLDVPESRIWKQAWTCALLMDSAPVAQFLAACYGARNPDRVELGACQRPLMCPAGWNIPDEEEQ